jgi:hypothetical protein
MAVQNGLEDDVFMTTALIVVAWFAVAMLLAIATCEYRVTLK